VEYKNPQDGQTYVMPIGHHNLQSTSEANLIEIAEYHDYVTCHIVVVMLRLLLCGV
jgi:hypothetical protein